MAHDWIFDVLNDMRSYASKNGLPALAGQLDEALRVARAEIGPSEAGPRSEDGSDD
jgi:hypothetical protein